MNNDGDIHFEDRIPLTKKMKPHTLEMKSTKPSIYSWGWPEKRRKCGAHGSNLSHSGRRPGRVKNGNPLSMMLLSIKILYIWASNHTLDTGHEQNLDAFQMRGLLSKLKRTSALINRNTTNTRTVEKIIQLLSHPAGTVEKSFPFSEFHLQRRTELLGHVPPCDNDDPQRQASLVPDFAQRTDYGTKWVEKPRQNWLHHTRNVLQKIFGPYDYNESQADDRRIYDAVLRKHF